MKSILAATFAVLATACGHAVAAEEIPYLDDRSDPAALVRSLYNAIDRQEYARAWEYFGETKPAKDFDSFAKGYEGTAKVDVATGEPSEEGAAGSIYFNLPVAIRATGKDGGQKVFAGCYTLRQVNGTIQAPPFQPMRIEKGALKPSDKDFQSALPQSCGDGPQPPKKDAALEKARKAFLAAYGEQCDDQPPGGKVLGEPSDYSIRYKPAAAAENDPDKTARLFRFFCTMGAYNESSVYYMTDEAGNVRQLQFAVPELDIRYENGDTNGKVEHMNVTGFRTVDQLVNADYDQAAYSIISHDKWRGVGDASTTGTYLFRNGEFSLVQYEVDPSYDGEVNPQTVLDYNTAP
ncbi:DUF1176 domain-containing protein [Mesorhizobium sp. SP-1A]|uniref:DUF1176 domain-containing protein n=1 Tax=Mesorhizobium sp. SP-1A TaxID=3077840 RepID=UPI0028F6C3CE|nr:DUF1176 domain-containing protein [Mesorhizobium sp. SP-1A]